MFPFFPVFPPPSFVGSSLPDPAGSWFDAFARHIFFPYIHPPLDLILSSRVDYPFTSLFIVSLLVCSPIIRKYYVGFSQVILLKPFVQLFGFQLMFSGLNQQMTTSDRILTVGPLRCRVSSTFNYVAFPRAQSMDPGPGVPGSGGVPACRPEFFRTGHDINIPVFRVGTMVDIDIFQIKPAQFEEIPFSTETSTVYFLIKKAAEVHWTQTPAYELWKILSEAGLHNPDVLNYKSLGEELSLAELLVDFSPDFADLLPAPLLLLAVLLLLKKFLRLLSKKLSPSS
jgi:hypothetical protein